MSQPAQHRAMLGWLCASAVVAGAVGLTAACGSAPEPPTSGLGSNDGAGSASSTDGQILPNLPVSNDPPREGTEEDAGSGDRPDVLSDPGAVEAGPPEGSAYFACESEVVGCEYIYVTARDFEAALCIQLTLENCGSGIRTLAVNTPLGWRLASASVVAGTDDCAPGEFYERSAPATAASGSITWDVEARSPADFVIDITLQLALLPELDLPRQASLSTSALTGPLEECSD